MSDPLARGSLFVSVCTRQFLRWYFFSHPLAILKSYVEHAAAFASVFSFFYLLKTLFSPWKQISDRYPDNLLQLWVVFQVFTLNMTARGVGFVVRTVTLAIGLVVQVVVAVVFLLYLMTWVTYPVLVLVGVPYVLSVIVS